MPGWQHFSYVACLLWWFARKETNMVKHDTGCPFWDEVSFNKTKLKHSLKPFQHQRPFTGLIMVIIRKGPEFLGVERDNLWWSFQSYKLVYWCISFTSLSAFCAVLLCVSACSGFSLQSLCSHVCAKIKRMCRGCSWVMQWSFERLWYWVKSTRLWRKISWKHSAKHLHIYVEHEQVSVERLHICFRHICLRLRGDKMSMLNHTYLHRKYTSVEDLSGHLQSPGWWPTLHVTCCLIQWLVSRESMLNLTPKYPCSDHLLFKTQTNSHWVKLQ